MSTRRIVNRIYAAHLVMVEEQIWRAPARSGERRWLELVLFSAGDDEAAYARAAAMAAGMGDEHCDGPGERTRYHSPGIHELALVFEGEAGDWAAALGAPYGVEAGRVDGSVEPRPRETLALFNR